MLVLLIVLPKSNLYVSLFLFPRETLHQVYNRINYNYNNNPYKGEIVNNYKK